MSARRAVDDRPPAPTARYALCVRLAAALSAVVAFSSSHARASTEPPSATHLLGYPVAEEHVLADLRIAARGGAWWLADVPPPYVGRDADGTEIEFDVVNAGPAWVALRVPVDAPLGARWTLDDPATGRALVVGEGSPPRDPAALSLAARVDDQPHGDTYHVVDVTVRGTDDSGLLWLLLDARLAPAGTPFDEAPPDVPLVRLGDAVGADASSFQLYVDEPRDVDLALRVLDQRDGRASAPLVVRLAWAGPTIRPCCAIEVFPSCASTNAAPAWFTLVALAARRRRR